MTSGLHRRRDASSAGTVRLAAMCWQPVVEKSSASHRRQLIGCPTKPRYAVAGKGRGVRPHTNDGERSGTSGGTSGSMAWPLRGAA